MSNAVDRQYFASRMADELDQAEQSKHSTVAAAHYEFAYRYARLAFEKAEATSVIPFMSKRAKEQLLEKVALRPGCPTAEIVAIR